MAPVRDDDRLRRKPTGTGLPPPAGRYVAGRAHVLFVGRAGRKAGLQGSGQGSGRAVRGACACWPPLGMGNLSQVNAMAAALQGAFGTPPPLTGAVVALATGVLLWRGLKGVGGRRRASGPADGGFLSGGGPAGGGTARRAAAGGAGSHRPGRAFGLRAAGGGLVGYGVWTAVRWGFARGCFSSEADLAPQPSPAARPSTPEPVQQGMWGDVPGVRIHLCGVHPSPPLAILTAGLVDLDTGRVAFSAPVEQLAGGGFRFRLRTAGPGVFGRHRGPVRLVLHFGGGASTVRPAGPICWGPDSLWIYKLVFLALTAAGGLRRLHSGSGPGPTR